MFGNQSKTYLERLVRQGNNNPICIGKEILSVSTIKSLTIPSGATYCEIRVESSNTATPALRYWMDGSTPTASEGMPLSNLDLMDILNAQNMVNFKVIQTGAGTHTLSIQYYK